MLLTRRITLRPREHIVTIVRRSPLAYAWVAGLALVLLLVNAFSTALLLRWSGVGVALYTAGYVLGVLLLLRTMWYWYWTAFVVTNMRIIDIDQRGMFHRSIAEARFERIEDITFEIKGVWATLFHLGTIRIQTAGASTHIALQSIARPERTHDLIGRLQELAMADRHGGAPTADSRGDALEDAEPSRAHERRMKRR